MYLLALKLPFCPSEVIVILMQCVLNVNKKVENTHPNLAGKRRGRVNLHGLKKRRAPLSPALFVFLGIWSI
jgi:hypothetical protein